MKSTTIEKGRLEKELSFGKVPVSITSGITTGTPVKRFNDMSIPIEKKKSKKCEMCKSRKASEYNYPLCLTCKSFSNMCKNYEAELNLIAKNVGVNRNIGVFII